MQLSIQILSVTVGTKQGKKPYQNAEVAFKNLTDGKVNSKNITQYSKVFKVAADAQAGQFYNVESVKNGEYWEWESMERVLDGAPPPVVTQASKSPAANTSPRSTYETPEERAQRQVYIVKQSSISSAIATLSVGAKSPPDSNKVLEVAQQYVDWVFGKKEGIDGIISLPNDIDPE